MSLEVKFGVSTWLWTSPFDTETVKLFPLIKEMGYDAVEIPVEDPALINCEKVKHALLESGLEPIICGAFGAGRDLTNDAPSIQKTSLGYIKECLRICEQLGGKFVAGPMYSAVGKARLVTAEQRKIEWERAVTNLRLVCAQAGEMGLEIALEPLNRFESDLVNTGEDVMRLVEDINHPAAKVMLDGFHMNIEETDVEKAIKLVGDKLVHFQVSENHRGVPGTGQTRWDAIKRGLEAIHYPGVVSVESFTPDIKELSGSVCIWRSFAPSQDDFAREGLKFLKRWAKDIKFEMKNFY